MAGTYGQLKDGKRISYQEFEDGIKPFLHFPINPKLCKKLYTKGYTISDAISYFILNT